MPRTDAEEFRNLCPLRHATLAEQIGGNRATVLSEPSLQEGIHMNAIGHVFDSWGWILLLQALARRSPVYLDNSRGAIGATNPGQNAAVKQPGEFSQPGVGRGYSGGHIDIRV